MTDEVYVTAGHYSEAVHNVLVVVEHLYKAGQTMQTNEIFAFE